MVDTSVVVSWYVESQRHAATDRLMFEVPGSLLHVPRLFLVEVANTARSLTRRFPDRAEDHAEFVNQVLALPIEVHEVPPLADLPRLVRESLRWGLTAYDATYLRLALQLKLPLATLDDGLRRAARDAGVELLI